MNLTVAGNEIDITPVGIPLCQRVFAHATEIEGAGIFPQRTGWVLLLLFFPIKKSKNLLIRYGAPRITSFFIGKNACFN
ncbi:MAG: hypothetical protein C4518_17080 [Desulfobacteraceae bacterium]|nr:MAG: hypothetical protein C4518_17080 [Desulfobacteraceae bacterium]